MKTVPLVQSIQPFHVAIGVWGDLTKLDGLHWNCGDGAEALKAGWWAYDKDQRPKAPPLNKRFKRILFTDTKNEFNNADRLNYLKVLHFFMAAIAQGVVIISTQTTTTDEIMKLCTKAGFPDVKRIQDGCVLIHKY